MRGTGPFLSPLTPKGSQEKNGYRPRLVQRALAELYVYTELWWRIIGRMRRIQIYLDEALDDAVATEARRRGVSKAALIRDAVAGEVPRVAAPAGDPWAALIGIGRGDGAHFDIDEVVYGEPA